MIIIYLLPTLFIPASIGKTLEMVHLVYRHGARSPIHFYPNDKIQEKDWPDGGGRLTQKGLNMEYNLGKFLKQRYIINRTFIDPMYVHTQVYIRSSDVERCLQSAEAQLAGLYPPSGYQIWNPDIKWQPIPVHTVPMHLDTILRPDDTYCPRLKQKWEERRKTPEYKQKVMENEKLFKTLSYYTGMNVTEDTIGQITDTTICEKTDGRPVGEWVKKVWNETLNLGSWFFADRYKGDDELGRLLGGSFLWKINDNMKKMRDNIDLKNLFKMNIFSGHDTSLLSLSTALNVDIGIPHFSACIMVELYRSENGDYFVEMFYRNDQTNNTNELKLNNCDHSCPLQDFISLTKQRTTEDVSKICGISRNTVTRQNLIVLVIISATVAFILMLIIVFCFVKRSKHGIRSKHVTEGEYLISDNA